MNGNKLESIAARAFADRKKSAISWSSSTVCELLELIEQLQASAASKELSDLTNDYKAAKEQAEPSKEGR